MDNIVDIKEFFLKKTSFLPPLSRPYIIAEVGVNHEGSLERAKKMIELAREGGADAVKFQTYKAETLASRNSPAYWDMTKEPTKSQYELFKRHDSFGEEEYLALYEHSQKVGIDFLSTPFDLRAVEFLAPLCPFIKIASADITNMPLLRKAGATGRPVALSTGASTLSEIETALKILKEAGCKFAALFHCILNYPTSSENAHLGMIVGLRRAFPDIPIGYSDHTLPDEFMTSLVTAFLLGAVIIEKHFTDDKSLPGNDHYHAMDIKDLRRFVSIIEDVLRLVGPTIMKSPIDTEDIARENARRSIVTAKEIPEGHIVTEDDIIAKRPATGISPLFWDEVTGKRALRDLPEDYILSWKDISSK